MFRHRRYVSADYDSLARFSVTIALGIMNYCSRIPTSLFNLPVV